MPDPGAVARGRQRVTECYLGSSGAWSSGNSCRPPYDLSMTSVLLAEDDPSISEPLARALRREGYEVGVSADGPATIEAARAGGVDPVLRTIRLPKLDGLRVCPRIPLECHRSPRRILRAPA